MSLQNHIPLSKVQVEDLMVVFDEHSTGQLDYRDLATSMGLWRQEKKETKKHRQMSTDTLKDSYGMFSFYYSNHMSTYCLFFTRALAKL